jgi:hypothetical protein
MDYIACLANLIFQRGGVTHAAAALGVDARTVRRWRSGATTPSPAYQAMLCQVSRVVSRELETLSPAWRGWCIGGDGLLYSREYARGWKPEDITGLHWDRQELRYLRQQVKALRAQVETLQEQPAPGTQAPRVLDCRRDGST